MKNKVIREAIKEGDKVFLISKSIEDKSKDNRTIIEEKTIKTQVTNEVLDEYETDRKEQYEGFKFQEKEAKEKIKKIEKEIKDYVNQRGYKAYKKNFDQYEIYENFIENKTDVTKFLTGESLKDFQKYEKKRDSYKHFYVTVMQENQLDMLKNNINAFEDIWEEDKMFIKQIKDARKLLNE